MGIKTRINSNSRVSPQDHSADLIGLKKIFTHVNLISIGKYIKDITKHKIKIHLECLKFQLEIKNVWRK